jgi:3-methyladenine DNA glycosylase AlkD
MTLAEVMRAIEAKGKAATAAIYRRHGVAEPTVGLSYAELGMLAKRIGVDHALAMQLWDTGVHDARIVATKIADPAQLTRATLAAWLEACTNYIVTDAVSNVAAHAPGALDLARTWIASREEWTSAAGWTSVAILAMEDGIDETLAEELIALIAAGIHGAPNRTRHAMNSALIAIGGAMPGLRARALKAAAAIGRVAVDHGDTGCKTPDAASMIDKMANHRAARRAGGTAPRTPSRVTTTRSAGARPVRLGPRASVREASARQAAARRTAARKSTPRTSSARKTATHRATTRTTRKTRGR